MSDARNSAVYRTICGRLREFSPPIDLEQLIDFNHVAPDGKLTFRAEPTVLGGIFFHAKDFHRIWEAFRTANNRKGQRAFDYYSLKRSKLEHFFKSVFSLNMLDISYLATRGYGFREIWSLFELDERPLIPQRERGQNFSHGFDRSFANRFGSTGTVEKRRDITSVHVALLDDICNIHIDDVGFVVRSLSGEGGMSPDFGQHLVDELLWKTFLSPILADLGENVTLDLPSSRNNYAPSIGLTLELPKLGASFSGAFTFNCKCLQGGRTYLDVPPGGWSVGFGFKKTF